MLYAKGWPPGWTFAYMAVSILILVFLISRDLSA